MKKILIACLLFTATVAVNQSYGQGLLDKAKKAAGLNVLPISDVSGTANSILGVLKPKLALSDGQLPKITPLLTEFLTSKSGILGLAKSNPTEYTNKFSGIKTKLFNGLKTALTAAQYSKLLGLKPKASDAGNVLSHLFF